MQLLPHKSSLVSIHLPFGHELHDERERRKNIMTFAFPSPLVLPFLHYFKFIRPRGCDTVLYLLIEDGLWPRLRQVFRNFLIRSRGMLVPDGALLSPFSLKHTLNVSQRKTSEKNFLRTNEGPFSISRSHFYALSDHYRCYYCTVIKCPRGLGRSSARKFSSSVVGIWHSSPS